MVDPRDIGLAAQADLHLKLRPGTNVAFANGIVNVLLAEGLYDAEFVRERTEGIEVLAATVRDYTPARVAEICDIDAARPRVRREDVRRGGRGRPSCTAWA